MKNITLHCPVNHTGYGIASLNIIKQLKSTANINYIPIGQPAVSSQEEYILIQSLLNNQDLIDITAPIIKIWHQFDLGLHFGKGKYFAFPFFELDTFNTREKQHLSVPDILFATSEWAKHVITDNNISTPTHVIPLGVDLSIFDHSAYKNENNKYVFLNIGKWEVRKGHDILWRLFQEAFPTEKDVELWILASESTNAYSTPEQLIEWKKLYGNDERIKLSPGVQSHTEIAQIISHASCGIFPSRAEGWNLELLEMMAMNKPVIATDYSGHTEFCDKNNSYLVDINETEAANDGKAFYGQGNWAKLGQDQYDQIIEHMRYVYKNRISDNAAGLETSKKFSWENSASKILRCIKEYTGD
jgi:glycosyltransferase involved in cell wall biosynthesis